MHCLLMRSSIWGNYGAPFIAKVNISAVIFYKSATLFNYNIVRVHAVCSKSVAHSIYKSTVIYKDLLLQFYKSHI